MHTYLGISPLELSEVYSQVEVIGLHHFADSFSFKHSIIIHPGRESSAEIIVVLQRINTINNNF